MLTRSPPLPPPPFPHWTNKQDGTRVYWVYKILDRRDAVDSNGRTFYEYRVSWEGWPRPEDDTWEPHSHFEHSGELVEMAYRIDIDKEAGII